jgi:hypothetical protein
MIYTEGNNRRRNNNRKNHHHRKRREANRTRAQHDSDLVRVPGIHARLPRADLDDYLDSGVAMSDGDILEEVMGDADMEYESCAFSDEEELLEKNGNEKPKRMKDCFLCHFYDNLKHYVYSRDSLSRFESVVMDSKNLTKDWTRRTVEAAEIFNEEIIEATRQTTESERMRRQLEGIEIPVWEYGNVRVTQLEVANHFTRHTRIAPIMLENSINMEFSILSTLHRHHTLVVAGGKREVVDRSVKLFNSTVTTLLNTVKAYKEFHKP